MHQSLLILFPTFIEAKSYLLSVQEKIRSKEASVISPDGEHELSMQLKRAELPLLKALDLPAVQPIVFQERGTQITIAIVGVGLIQPLITLGHFFTRENLQSYSHILLTGICAVKNAGSPPETLLSCKKVCLIPPNFFGKKDHFALSLHDTCHPAIEIQQVLYPGDLNQIECCYTSAWALGKEDFAQAYFPEKSPFMIEMEAYPIACHLKSLGLSLQILKVLSDSCDIAEDGALIAQRMPRLSQTCSNALLQWSHIPTA